MALFHEYQRKVLRRDIISRDSECALMPVLVKSDTGARTIMGRVKVLLLVLLVILTSTDLQSFLPMPEALSMLYSSTLK
jgi:hypothetical protein